MVVDFVLSVPTKKVIWEDTALTCQNGSGFGPESPGLEGDISGQGFDMLEWKWILSWESRLRRWYEWKMLWHAWMVVDFVVRVPAKKMIWEDTALTCLNGSGFSPESPGWEDDMRDTALTCLNGSGFCRESPG